MPVSLEMADDQLERERRDYITIVPQNGLEEGKLYTVKIDTSLMSKSGSNLEAPVEVEFTTQTTEKPVNMIPVYVISGVVVLGVVIFIIYRTKHKN